MLSAIALTACSDDDATADSPKDWQGTTTQFVSSDAQGFATYYMPSVGRVGDPMPFYDQKAGDFKVLYLQQSEPPLPPHLGRQHQGRSQLSVHGRSAALRQ